MGAEDTQEVLASGPEFAKQMRTLMEQQALRGTDNSVSSPRVVALLEKVVEGQAQQLAVLQDILAALRPQSWTKHPPESMRKAH
jgi:predicted transcriptional regulator